MLNSKSILSIALLLGIVVVKLLLIGIVVVLAYDYHINHDKSDVNDTNVSFNETNNTDSPIAYIYREFCADGTLYWELTNVNTHSVHVGLRLHNKANTVQVLECE